MGAKVNGRIVPLKYNLKNGDVVEILTQTGHLPSKDWLGAGEDASGAQQNQARHQYHRARQGDRDRPEISGAGSAPVGRPDWRGSPRPSWSAWRASTATARWRICTRRSVTASFPRARCSKSWHRISEPLLPPEAPKAAQPARDHRSGGAGDQRPGHQGEGRRRSAGLSRQVLQSDSRRGHRRLRHARQRHRGAFHATAPTSRI